MKRSMLILIVMACGLAGVIPVLAADSEITYSGRAYGALVDLATVPLSPVILSDTGHLPPEGGELIAFLLGAVATTSSGDTALVAEAMYDTTRGALGTAQSSARTEDAVVLPGDAAEVTATTALARSEVSCGSAFGHSVIENLTFGGVSVVVTGEPNQTVSIPGVATLVINEQVDSDEDGVGNASTAEITVNALHLSLATGEEIIISHAHSDVGNCLPPVPVEPSTWGTIKSRYHH